MLLITATLLLLPLKFPKASRYDVLHPSIIATELPPAPPGEQVRFENLTSEDGLSSNRVTSILRDNRGFMWFGTFDGLNRYDGYEFKVYRHDASDEYSLSANLVVTLYQDREGLIWVGTSGGGLNRYDPTTEQFIHYQHDPSDLNSLSSTTVLSIYEDRQGTLWVGTDSGGLNRYDPTTGGFVRYQNDPEDPFSLSNDTIWAISEDKQGTLWVGTEGGGLNRMNRENGQFTIYRNDPMDPKSLSQNNVRAIYENSQGELWIGTGGGLDRLDPETSGFTHYRNDPSDPFSLSHDFVVSIHEGQSGTLWVGTSVGGLNRFDRQTGSFEHYQADPDDPDSLSHNTIREIYEDTSGLLWIGTVGGGVNWLDLQGKQFAYYGIKSGDPISLNSNDIHEIYEDRHGVLWIGTGDGGLNRLDRQNMQVAHYTHIPDEPNSLSNNRLRAIVEDQAGYLWLATHSGLNRFDPQLEQFSVYHADPGNPSGLLSSIIWSLHVDTQGILWVGTNLGLNRFDPRSGQFTAYQNDPQDPDSLSGSTITVIQEDQQGYLWLGTLEAGLNRYDRETGRFSSFKNNPDNPQSLSGNTVWSIYESKDGTLWIGTSAGLDKLDQETGEFVNYRSDQGLPGGGVMSILEDDLPPEQGGSNLWLGTSMGLYKFNPRTETVQRYDVKDGLQGNDFVWGSAFKSPSGELFFGGSNGLTSFYPHQVKASTYLPPVVFTALHLANKPVEIGGDSILQVSITESDHMTLSHEDRVVSFEFAALDYRAPATNRYRYMLEGFDDGWTEVGADRRFVTYTNLDPGEYEFHVIGSNSDGVWNEEGTSISITITPPWWQTIWFRGGLILVTVAGLFGAYRWRVKSLETRSQELETQVAEKTRQLDERVKELTTLLTVAQDVVSTLDLEPLLNLILEQLKVVVDYDVATIRRLKQDAMQLQAYQGLSTQEERPAHRLPVAGVPVIQKMVQTQQAFIINDVQFDPALFGDFDTFEEMPTGVVLRTSRTLMGVPLHVKGEVIGMLVLGHRQPDYYDQEMMNLAQAFANQAAVAIVNAELYEQAGEAATLEERTRLARELHDSATQALYSATLFSEAGKELAEQGDLESASYYLSRVGEVVHQALKDMRLLVFQLRRPVLEKEGLLMALRHRLDAVEKRAGMDARLISDHLPRLSDSVSEELYCITIEALNNLLKHAQADTVTITIRSDEGVVDLEVHDDGQGFDPQAAYRGGGMGLTNMAERAAKLGADLTIDSSPDQGTSIRIIVPPAEPASKSHPNIESKQ